MLLNRLIPGPYRSVLREAPFRQFLAGAVLSSLGDDMSAVGLVWLALTIAPKGSEGLVVALALAAYYIPGIPLGLLFGRKVQQLGARRMILLDSANRCLFLGAIPVFAWTGRLNVASFVVLLTVSSIFHAWGVAGRRTITADLFEPQDRLAANSLLFGGSQLTTVIGPALAGIITTAFGAEQVILLDAASFAAFFVLAWGVPVREHLVPLEAKSTTGRSSLKRLLAYPTLHWLLGLTFLFFLFYGPVVVALPLQVERNYEGGAGLLGALWSAFGIGAVLGSLAAGGKKRLPMKMGLLGIVAGWGLAVVILGYTNYALIALAAMAFGGLVYGPYQAIIATVIQAETLPEDLSQVGAAWASILLGASPVGIALGGPLVSALGPTDTLLLSGLATISLAAVAGLLAALHKENTGVSPSPVKPSEE